MTAFPALNMITLLYAYELRDTAVTINAASPGYCATDLNDFQGVLSAADGAKVIARVATQSDGTTAALLNADGVIAY